MSTVYIGTRGEWGTVDVVFVDDITNSVQQRVQEQVAKQQNFFDQTMSRAGENYKFEIDLDVLAGGQSAGGSASDPNIIQKWCFAGCQITNMNMNEMSYEEATAMEVTLTLRYDNVIGFNQDGFRMGVFSHAQQIQSQQGVISTGSGSAGGGVSTSGASVSIGVSGSTSIGGVSVGGSAGGSFGL